MVRPRVIEVDELAGAFPTHLSELFLSSARENHVTTSTICNKSTHQQGQSTNLGKPSRKKSAVFLNIVQKAFDPLPLSFEHHVVNFLKSVFEH